MRHIVWSDEEKENESDAEDAGNEEEEDFLTAMTKEEMIDFLQQLTDILTMASRNLP